MRGMERAVVWAAVPLVVALCAVGAADASTTVRNGVTAIVDAEPPTFGPSIDGRISYGAYRITVINGTSSALNNYRFRAKLETAGAEFTEANPVQRDTATCTRLTLSEIDCTVGYGGLVLKDTQVSFNVQIKNPTLEQAATTPPSVLLRWDVRPGDGEALGYMPGTTTTLLSEKDPTGPIAEVESVIPASTTGYYLYTGVNNIPGLSDHTTASTIVSKVDKLILATIVEGTSTNKNNVCPEGSVARFCSQITVKTGDGVKAKFDPRDPDNSTLSDKLRIVLRIGASDVVGQNISQALIYYSPDPGTIGRSTAGFLSDCPKPNKSNYVPTPGDGGTSPCIHSRTVLSKRLGENLAGVWEFVIFALDNGRFELL